MNENDNTNTGGAPLSPESTIAASETPAIMTQVETKDESEAVADDRELYVAFVEGEKVGTAKPRIIEGITREDMKLSGFGFLLGPFYFAYRKCWEATAVLLAAITVLFIIEELIGSSLAGVNIAFGWLYTVGFYPVYRGKAKKMVERAKREIDDDTEREQWLRAQGGTSIPMMLAALAIFILILTVDLVLTMPNYLWLW